MAKITIVHEFSDVEDGNVGASFKIVSDPPFPEKIKEWTEAQKSAVWFAEHASKILEAEAEEQGCCEQGGCSCHSE